jgi:hypothetical protein
VRLEIARGMFLVAALSVSVFAAASWYEPGHGVVSGHGRSYCVNPDLKRVSAPQVQANQNLLWLMLSLSQGMRPQG